ncbi:MAG: prepilin-type N-terminal cleavage/methylation domain-containing protein [Planctomycetales bacterium]|nr:prepilin-type N-terminal cleavage/methylation domain-containing protein [Planctomycetales bacterium]
MSVRYNAARRGLTLIELVVVLLILVGLAGVVIPAVTNMVGRTHTSSGAANISQIANALQRFEVQYMSYPDNFDSLVTDLGAGTALNTLDGDLALDTVALSADTFAALEEAGITTVGLHAINDGTFEVPTPTLLADTNTLLGLTPAQQVELGLETVGVAGKYICLGVGSSCTANGKTMMDAPVHFPESGEANPATTYGRFLAVFQITDGTDALERAKLAAVISPHGAGLGDHIAEYFEISQQD